MDADSNSMTLNKEVSADELIIGIFEFFMYKTSVRHYISNEIPFLQIHNCQN